MIRISDLGSGRLKEDEMTAFWTKIRYPNATLRSAWNGDDDTIGTDTRFSHTSVQSHDRETPWQPHVLARPAAQEVVLNSVEGQAGVVLDLLLLHSGRHEVDDGALGVARAEQGAASNLVEHLLPLLALGKQLKLSGEQAGRHPSARPTEALEDHGDPSNSLHEQA